jgi:hypothetical protein
MYALNHAAIAHTIFRNEQEGFAVADELIAFAGKTGSSFWKSGAILQKCCLLNSSFAARTRWSSTTRNEDVCADVLFAFSDCPCGAKTVW